MSDSTLNQTHPYLKEQNLNLKKLKRAIDQLNILIHQQKRLTKCCQELARRCLQLADNMDQMDVLAFEIQQELDNPGSG